MKRFFRCVAPITCFLLLIINFNLSVYSQQPRIAGTALTNGPGNGGSIFFHDLPVTNPSPIYYFDNETPDQALTSVTRGDLDWIYGTLMYNGADGTGCLFRIRTNGTQFEKLSNLNAFSAVTTTPYFHSDNFVYYASQNGFRKFSTISQSHVGVNVPNPVLAHHLVIDAADWIYYTTTVGTIDKVKTDGSFHQTLHTFGLSDGTGGTDGLVEIPGDSLIGVHTAGGSADVGTIYSIKKDGTGFTVLHEFDMAIGGIPLTRPLYFDGKLFGSTSVGGAENNGVVYSINPDGTNYRVIKDIPQTFGGGSQSQPGGSFHIAGNGRIFGTFHNTFQVPVTFQYHMMFKLDTSGENFETFVQYQSQRQSGEYLLGAYIEDDEEMYLITNRMGRHDGGVLMSFDTLGNGADIHHFGFTERGYNPNRLIKCSDGLLYGTNVIGGNTGNGIIYSIDETGDDFSLLNEFTDADGFEPKGKLLEGTDGNLYGVLVQGGTTGTGAIYRMNKTGSVFDVIFSPTNFPEGFNMNGDLIEYNNAIYGTSMFGGNTGIGTVFRVNKDGSGYTVLKHFTGNPDLSAPTSGVIYHNGYLYGCTANGGVNNLGGIYRMQVDGSNYQVLHSFNNTDGANAFFSPIIANNSLLYGTAQQGGSAGTGVLFRIELDGDNYTVLRNFNFDVDGFIPNGLIQASDGNLYGTTAANVALPGQSDMGGTIYRVGLDGTGFTTIFRANYDILGGNLDGLLDFSTTALPVELLTFNGRSENGGVLLSWKTANEQNSDRFSIERSTDGLNFVPIGSVRAAGNSSTTLSYNFTDRTPHNGKNYYRLKQFDIDQSYTYSRIVLINFGKESQLIIYPNPATNYLTVVLPKDVKQLKVIDAGGRVVMQRQVSSSSLTEEIDLRAFAKGVYVLQVYGNVIVSRSFVKE